MNLALPLTRRIAAWRRYAPANAFHVAAVCAGLAVLPVLAIHYVREPASGPRLAGFGGPGGMSGTSLVPPGFSVGLSANDPVAHFAQSRIGHILYSPYSGDYCRRVLFHNQTGALYETGSILCVQSAPEGRTTTGADRLISLRKSFQK